MRATTIVVVGMLGCGAPKAPPASLGGPVDVGASAPPTEVPVRAEETVATGEIDLSPLRANTYTVAVGSTLTYAYSQHGSVGETVSQSVDDSSIVKLVANDVVYDHPERLEAGMSGADAAHGTFRYEAVAPGTATIEVQHLFRGAVQDTWAFAITVR